jgi:hypothetical protein
MNVPVLFIIFNRPEVTARVFSEIRKANPPRLYIAADGPRENRDGDAELCLQARSVVGNIDWPCKIHTRFVPRNLGCRDAVSSAIDWFFEAEEKGIILEDDCLPSESFFKYCEILLEKYEDDMRVWHISGANFQKGNTIICENDYYFSKHIHVWGWATWRSRWKCYDVNIERFNTKSGKEIIKSVWPEFSLRKYWLAVFTDLADGKIDTWDYQWMFTIWVNKGLATIPNVNLITNIGFGDAATHTIKVDHDISDLDKFELVFPLQSPDIVKPNEQADDFSMKKLFKWRKIISFLIVRKFFVK